MKKGGNTRLRPRPFIGRGLFYAGNRIKTFPGILKNIFSERIFIMTLYDELVARGLIAQVTDVAEIRELINNG